ncbi:putative tRNA-dihydrouridine(20) synthase-like [Homarus americanus]|uniref:Putative tRNA-dihydrouridine(20) synthase-like n=1 Tax=Homarus americanus TaxID=6706 RepID=A0A8J5MLL9_HOMAM|nr:putative tRNA-dihydrouridine(20) synthase-like [Homarus americanus]
MSYREKSKRYSEQGAAAVCLHALGVVHKTYGFIPADGARKYQYVLNDVNSEKEKTAKREYSENEDPETETEKATELKKRKSESNIFKRTFKVKPKVAEENSNSEKFRDVVETS